MNNNATPPPDGVSPREGATSDGGNDESRPRKVADAARLTENSREEGDTATAPKTRSLRGVLRGAPMGEIDYLDHLADRHR